MPDRKAESSGDRVYANGKQIVDYGNFSPFGDYPRAEAFAAGWNACLEKLGDEEWMPHPEPSIKHP